MTKSYGPTLPVSEETHAEKYRAPDESYEKAMSRVANALKDDQPHYRKFREIILENRFAPGGRVQSAAGSSKVVTPYNCFVSGTIEDTFVDGHGSIMQMATEAAATLRLGGGIGYDFSTLRPMGALIKKLGSNSTGPVSFMHIYDAVCRCVASSGHRRGAQMGVLRIDHPDIEAFIDAKADETTLTQFNISIAVTDEFMEALEAKRPFPLRFGGTIYREVDPVALWDKVMRHTWDWAEPGVLFIDTINRMNNLWYAEKIAATNPCGEQPLPPYGACLLGSYNIVRYITKSKTIDLDQIAKDMPHVVRAMDNVVDRAEYPLPEHGREARSKRRMGLGVMGIANAIEYTGHPYGTPGFIKAAEEVLETIRDSAYQASVALAREKGSFALFDRERYGDGQFISTLPMELQKDISKYGIRNSHLTSIAPTGTISLSSDNVSSGIEPVFSHYYDRTIIDGATGKKKKERVTDYAYREWGLKGKTTNEVTVDEHLDVLITAALRVDSAVSKTCNVPGTVDFEEFKTIYTRAYEGGAKGCTTYRKDGKRGGILEEVKEDQEGKSCRIDPTTGRRECD